MIHYKLKVASLRKVNCKKECNGRDVLRLGGAQLLFLKFFENTRDRPPSMRKSNEGGK
jgi:hypothetical protein